MQKSSKYEWGLLLFLAAIIFPVAKTALAADGASPPDATASAEIPTGFKLDRYVGLWERNPFTMGAPSMPQPKRSVFDKLFLTSWLKDGRSDVVFIQDSETNEVQKITAEPNKDNLRLIALRLSPSPQLVEALISDGKEVRPVKFRLEAQSSAAQNQSPMTSNSASAPTARLQQPQMSLPGGQASSATMPVNQPVTQGSRSGRPRARIQGNQRPHGESEALHLPPPGQSSG